MNTHAITGCLLIILEIMGIVIAVQWSINLLSSFFYIWKKIRKLNRDESADSAVEGKI